MVNKIKSQIKENKRANRCIILFLCGIVISWMLTCTSGYIFNSLLQMPNSIQILLATVISRQPMYKGKQKRNQMATKKPIIY